MTTTKLTDEQYFIKKGFVKKQDMLCYECKEEGDILSISNWNDGTGVLYMMCKCGVEYNVRWINSKKAKVTPQGS